jgi:hypothetical protein
MGEGGLFFGDYVEIEQKRHGVKNEMYLHKVINTSMCNSWVDVPVQSPAKETLHRKTMPVVRCVCCGVCETEALAYLIKDVKKASAPGNHGFNYETHKYLCFEELEAKPKTKQFAVKNKTSDFILGYVKWHGPWRRYCFFIDRPDLVFDAGCLAEICDFINKLMLERKTEKSNNQMALAKVGVAALIDEATGYQNARGKDALNKLYQGYSGKEKDQKND